MEASPMGGRPLTGGPMPRRSPEPADARSRAPFAGQAPANRDGAGQPRDAHARAAAPDHHGTGRAARRARAPRSVRVLRGWTIVIGILCALCVGALIWLGLTLVELNGRLHEMQVQTNSLTSDFAALEASLGKTSSDMLAFMESETPPIPVESPHTQSGTYTTGDAELDQMVKSYCDAHEDVYDAYLGIAWSEYVENDQNQDPQGSRWWVDYAKQQFANNAGNCYNFAAAIQEVLRYFGYEDATAFPAIVKMQSGDYGPHGLVTVTADGSRKVIDAARGTNGWMLEGDSIIYEMDDSKAHD